MAVYKEPGKNTWRVLYRTTDWKGEEKQSTKRGFKTKREALAWEREMLNKATGDLDMTFKSFIEHYTEDASCANPRAAEYRFAVCPHTGKPDPETGLAAARVIPPESGGRAEQDKRSMKPRFFQC